MALTCKLYKISDDPRALHKTLVDSGLSQNRVNTVSVNVRGSSDFYNLTFSVQIPSTGLRSTYASVNYIDCTTNGKKYFVTGCKIQPSMIAEYTCVEDVLATFETELKALNVTLERSESDNNGYLPDSQYTALGYRAIVCQKFPQGLTTDSFVLMTTG